MAIVMSWSWQQTTQVCFLLVAGGRDVRNSRNAEAATPRRTVPGSVLVSFYYKGKLYNYPVVPTCPTTTYSIQISLPKLRTKTVRQAKSNVLFSGKNYI